MVNSNAAARQFLIGSLMLIGSTGITCPAGAADPIEISSSSRIVSGLASWSAEFNGNVEGDGDFGSIEHIQDGLWEGTFFADAGVANSVADQGSLISTSLLSGHCEAEATLDVSAETTADAGGYCSFAVGFLVTADEAVPFTLTADFNYTGNKNVGLSRGQVLLSGMASTGIFQHDVNVEDPSTFNVTINDSFPARATGNLIITLAAERKHDPEQAIDHQGFAFGEVAFFLAFGDNQVVFEDGFEE